MDLCHYKSTDCSVGFLVFFFSWNSLLISANQGQEPKGGVCSSSTHESPPQLYCV